MIMSDRESYSDSGPVLRKTLFQDGYSLTNTASATLSTDLELKAVYRQRKHCMARSTNHRALESMPYQLIHL